MNDDTNLAEDLAQFDQEYESAPVEEKNFDDVPDGKYQVRIDKVELTRTRTSGTPILKWTLDIISGAHAGRKLFHSNMIGTAENVRWLKQDLHTCGIEIPKLSALADPDSLRPLLDVTLEVTKKSKSQDDKSYVSIYLNKRITISAPGGGSDFPYGANTGSPAVSSNPASSAPVGSTAQASAPAAQPSNPSPAKAALNTF